MKPSVVSAVVAAALLAVIGCSGGAGTGLAPATPRPAAGSPSLAQARVTLAIPVHPASAGAKTPAYVSADTGNLQFSGSGIADQDLVIGSLPNSNCPLSGGYYTCTLNFSAPVGDSTLTVTARQGATEAGAVLSVNTIPIHVIQDQVNTIPITLNGVVNALVLSVTPSTVTVGTATAATATLGALDAAGDAIVGPGALVDANDDPISPTLVSDNATDFTVGSRSGNSWPVSYDGANVAGATLTLSASGLASATRQFAVQPAGTPPPGGVNVITNGTFATNAFDGSAGWYRCYASRVVVAPAPTPINPSPAPVNATFTTTPNTTPAPTNQPATDVSQQSTTPSGASPPSGNPHFAIVGYATPPPASPGPLPQKGNTGICQDVTVPQGASLAFNIYEGGDDDWAKSDSEVDLYPAGTFTGTNPGYAPLGVAPSVHVMAENNCYDSAAWEPVFLAAPFGSGSVSISSTARWSGCPETPGGASPGGYSPSSGGGYWYSRTFDLSSYQGQSVTLFMGIGRDAGGSKPSSSGAQYYNYAFFDNVALTGTSAATPPPLSVAPNPFEATQPGAATLTASESGYAGQLTVSSDNASVITVTSPATASGGSATIDVDVVNAGFANITVTDSHGQSVVVPVTVTLTPVTIN